MQQYLQLVFKTDILDIVKEPSHEINVPCETILLIQSNRTSVFCAINMDPSKDVVETTLDGAAGINVYENEKTNIFAKSESFCPAEIKIKMPSKVIGSDGDAALYVQGTGSILSSQIVPITPSAGNGSFFFWG